MQVHYRGGNHDFWRAPQRGRLDIEGQAAHNKRDSDVCELRQICHHAVHLRPDECQSQHWLEGVPSMYAVARIKVEQCEANRLCTSLRSLRYQYPARALWTAKHNPGAKTISIGMFRYFQKSWSHWKSSHIPALQARVWE